MFAIMMQRIVFLHDFGPAYHELVLRTSLGLVLLSIDLYQLVRARMGARVHGGSAAD